MWFVSEPFGGCCGQRARTLRAAGGECAPHPDPRSCSSRAGVGTRSSPRSASAAPTQNHSPPQRPAVIETPSLTCFAPREFHVKIIVTGGRDYQDLVTVRRVLSEYHQEPRPILVHGGARGADRIAAYVARELGWHVVAYPADWRRHGRAAGPIRNQEMADAGADLCIAFPGGRGTADMVRRARAAGIPVRSVT